jgi:hypothetical protein
MVDEAFFPELSLLLDLLQVAVGTPVRLSEPPPAIDWPAFLKLVDRHRVAPILHHRAAKSIAGTCPIAVAQRIQAGAAANSRRALICAAEQLALVRILAANHIDVLAVKGLVLAHQLNGNFHARHVGDIDLLIRPTDALRADRLLQGAGWRRTNPAFSLTPLQARKFLRLKPEFEYVHAQLPVRAELRWEIEGLGDFETMFGRAISFQLGGESMRTLPADLNGVYLFQHGARHGWFRLFWLTDIALMMRSPSFNAPALLETARLLGAERALWQGTRLAEQLLGVNSPPALRPPPNELGRIAQLEVNARWIIVAPPRELDQFSGWLRQLIYRIRLQKSLRAKLAMLRPHVFSPATWSMWPLPDRWFFLYYFATPFLWLWRRARRSG